MQTGVAAAALLALWVPGAALFELLRLHSADRLTRFAHEIALGVGFWPLVLLYSSAAGLHWTSALARTLVVLLFALFAAARWRHGRALWARGPSVAAIVLTAMVVVTRITQISGVAYPLWVDSVHHTMIVRLLVDRGALPSSYAPFIPESTFYYHWGFHAVTAFVGWIAGVTAPAQLPRLLLVVGQVLNGLMFFAVYAGARALFRSRRTALIAATLALLVSYFPAYYVSWGRYTQLCGLLILPPLAAAFWQTGRHPSLRRGIEVVLLAAGLLLVHARVAAVFAILAFIVAVVLAAQGKWKGLAWCAIAGVTSVVLVSPWLLHLARTPQVQAIVAPGAAALRWETPNGIPPEILWAPNNLPLMVVSTAGLIGLTPASVLTAATRTVAIAVWLAIVALLTLAEKRPRRRVRRRDVWRLAVVVLWTLVTAALINLDLVHLPRFQLLTNSSGLIMLFLPMSFVAAHVLRWAVETVSPPKWRDGAVAVLAMAAGAAGATTMVHVVNPQTVFVTRADVGALDWIRGNLPRDSRFAVAVQPWIGGAYVGVDGGYWIPLVAGRGSILPPGLYPWVMPAKRVAEVSALLTRWHDAEEAGDLGVLPLLRANGVTHLYFGTRNALPLRSAMATSGTRRVYERDGVEVYDIRAGVEERK